MTSTTHTLAPWVIRRAKYGRGTTREIWGADGACVTGLTMRMTHGPTTEANANLIAAAPDLLAALQEAVNKGYMWDHDPELWSKANAAIAKAKGE